MKRYRVETAKVYGRKEAVIIADPHGGFVKWNIADDLLSACKLMYEAWSQLIPCLKNSSVENYQLVLTDAPIACKKAIEKAERNED